MHKAAEEQRDVLIKEVYLYKYSGLHSRGVVGSRQMHGKKAAATRNLQAISVIRPDMQKPDSLS